MLSDGAFGLRLSREPLAWPVVALVLCSLVGWTSADDTQAFTHVNVIPMDQERVLPDWTVVVKDHRIVAAGPSAEVVVPPRARRIDGRRKFLIPGLVDAQVHATVRHDLLLYLGAGVTTVQGLGSDAERSDRWARYIHDGKILGPNYVNCDSIAAGLQTAEEAESFVARVKKADLDCLKIQSPPDWTLEAYTALVHAARREGIRTVGRLPRNLALEPVLADGQDTIARAEEYLYAFFDKQPNPRDETLLASVAKWTADRRIAVMPDLVAYHLTAQQTGPSVSKLMKRPELQYVPEAMRAALAPPLNRNRKRDVERDSEPMLQTFAYLQKLTLALEGAGVTLALGTDASRDAPLIVPGFSALEELREMVAAGLTPYQALHAATAGAAQSMGAASEFGTIAVGQRADLLLLNANPLENVANVSRRAGVMVRGRWFFERELAQHLADYRAALSRQNAVIKAATKAGTDGPIADVVRMARRPVEQMTDEETVTELGRERLRRRDFTGAVAVLRLVAALFPVSWTAHDALGEAYMMNGNVDRAIASYERSLELNPANGGAVSALHKLRFVF
jgi:imidazolonepropionase-like amidohydrolase